MYNHLISEDTEWFWSLLVCSPYPSFDAQSTGVKHDPFPHPRNVLRGPLWLVAQNNQGRGVFRSPPYIVDSCSNSKLIIRKKKTW